MIQLPLDDINAIAAAVVARLKQSPFWDNALGDSERHAIPMLVQRLDHDDDIYQIVTLSKSQGITARIAIAGDDGRLLEVEGVQQAGASLPAYVDPLDVLQRAAKAHPAPGSAVFRPEMVGRHPVLVWKPCSESTSRFLPFWLVTIRDRLLYIRVDGAVFTHLTTTGHG